jgi:methanogen homocitrate synthase
MDYISRNIYYDSIGLKPVDVEICDVTLRDGEQTPGAAFTADEKIQLAHRLDEIGVEIIEAGFPVVSNTEKQTIQTIANLNLNAKICCLARSKTQDVDAALECDVDVISVFIATSDIHLKYKYHSSYEEMKHTALETLEYAKSHGLIVRFAAEDATRTPLERLKDIFLEAETHGADYVSIADTLGILTPTTTRYLVSEIKNTVKKSHVCIHCHDDLGMATANTITAAEAGAKQLHTTVNGIGERCGNASLEEVLLALRLEFGIDKYRLQHLLSLSRLVEEYSGITVAKNKSVVGENTFAHESGIHVAAILEDPRTYEAYPPELVGTKRSFILGKHTGRKALLGILRHKGYHDLTHEQLCELVDIIKEYREAKKELTDDRIDELVKKVERK